MTADELRAIVIKSLEKTIPEADAGSLDPRADLREQLDIDSMDVLRFIRALHDATKVEVPELDTPKLVTLDGAVSYLAEKLGVSV